MSGVQYVMADSTLPQYTSEEEEEERDRAVRRGRLGERSGLKGGLWVKGLTKVKTETNERALFTQTQPS